jgi:hypothetical protein
MSHIGSQRLSRFKEKIASVDCDEFVYATKETRAREHGSPMTGGTRRAQQQFNKGDWMTASPKKMKAVLTPTVTASHRLGKAVRAMLQRKRAAAHQRQHHAYQAFLTDVIKRFSVLWSLLFLGYAYYIDMAVFVCAVIVVVHMYM